MEDSAALRRLQNPTVVPTIDFTQHTMDDGRVVHTQERVVKGKHQKSSQPIDLALERLWRSDHQIFTASITDRFLNFVRGASSSCDGAI